MRTTGSERRRATALRALVLLGVGLAGSAAGALAHIQLQNPSSGNALFWADDGAIGIVIQSTGSDNLANGSHETALRNSIAAWNAVENTSARLVEDQSDAAQARTDWEADDIHLILFDENNSSGFFPAGTGIVALTPIWFVNSGQIIDADILFNGAAYQFTTSGFTGRFDVQDVGTHELGHLLGLDHSGWAGATMYPYVDPTVILHRSLSKDELNGLRDTYPAGGPYGSITGAVRRANGSPVAGAHVAIWDALGHSAGGTLSRDDGSFDLRALPEGSYTLYARPLDEPVSAANLTTPFTIETDFAVAFHPEPVVVTVGATTEIGALTVPADAQLNLGKNLDRYPLRVVTGGVQLVTVRGDRLFGGSTLTCSDPTIGVNVVNWLGSLVQVRLDVPADAPACHVDLIVDDGAAKSVLTAGLEITPPNPVVSTVVPALGPKAGGSALTIQGTGFRPGARVVIGNSIYADGEPGGCTVVDPETIVLTTGASVPGAHDVVVLDETGIEGRKAKAFTAASLPILGGVFPPAGDLAGGTLLRLTGADFIAGAKVRIDGVVQAAAVWQSAGQIEVTTAAGSLPGPYVIEVENPDGAVATSGFAYWDQPDPTFSQVNPSSGDTAGGQTLTITGSNFSAHTVVMFGSDPVTGLGGVAADSVSFLNATTLTVVTPSHGVGPVTIKLQESDTGQASLAPSAFQFVSASSAGGGGCGSIAAPGPPDLRDVLTGSWCLMLLALGFAVRAHGARRRLAAI